MAGVMESACKFALRTCGTLQYINLRLLLQGNSFSSPTKGVLPPADNMLGLKARVGYSAILRQGCCTHPHSS